MSLIATVTALGSLLAIVGLTLFLLKELFTGK